MLRHFFPLLKYFLPSNLFAGFSFVFSEWLRGGARERALLLLIFAPMAFCMLGLLYNFASFVFEFISRLLGWFLLTALFGGGGIFCYEKLRENNVFSSSQSAPHRTSSASYDAAADVSEPAQHTKTANANKEERGAKDAKQRRWFDGMN